MRNDNVIRVDFQNKQRFGKLQLIHGGKPEKTSVAVETPVVENISSNQIQHESLGDNLGEAAHVDIGVGMSNETFNAICETLAFYSHGYSGQPGWDSGNRAKATLIGLLSAQ